MKDLKEICNNINIPISLHSLLEASILADVEGVINYDINTDLFKFILSSKSKEDFNEYCEILSTLLIDESNKETSNIYCSFQSISYKGDASYYIYIGKDNKKLCYKIYYSFGRVNVEKIRSNIFDLRRAMHDNYGYLPKNVNIKNLF